MGNWVCCSILPSSSSDMKKKHSWNSSRWEDFGYFEPKSCEVGVIISWLSLSTQTMICRVLGTSVAKLRFLKLCCFLFKIAFLRSCRFQLPKKNYNTRQANFCPICVPASQQLVPKFFWFRHYCFIRYMNLASWFKEVSPPDNWEASIF